MRRFAEYAPRRFRSGKYSASELRAAIRDHAIARVVDLRDRDQTLLAQRTYASLGVEFVRWPVDERRPLSPDVLDVVDRPGTLVHCWKGSHRTGAVVAMLRLRAGWTPEATWAELQRFDFGPWADHAELAASVFGSWRPAC